MENDFYHLKTGSTITEYSFDAWGRRRNALNWSYDLTGQPALFADRGFTGHEFLADFNLYNMNGRLYDPVVGRFLSPDPYIADPSFSQSYNRYAYALNNPLKFNDPTGEKLKWPKFEGFHWFPILGQFDYFMQFINDNTTKTRQKMVNAGVPDFGVNYNTMFGTGFSVGNNPAYYPGYEKRISDGQRNISNHLVDVRKNYGPEWHASGQGGSWTSSVDWAGVTNASLNVLGGVGEMIVGGAGEYFSAGIATPACVPLVVDGGYRTATNFSRLVGYLTLNDRFANAMPGNIGATIGKGIDMLSGVPIDGYGYGQGIGGATNDFVSFIVTGGTAGSMSNMVSNPTLMNGVWYMSAYGGYTNSLFYDLYPLKK